MCLGAIYWARPDRVYYACTREDAAKIDFDDEFIYQEIMRPLDDRIIPMLPLLHDEGMALFIDWKLKPDKMHY
jgi:tRNA(Arg) A34 adenosine deaminase TadA